MPKFIIHPRVHTENPDTEVVEAAKVLPAEGLIVFLNENNEPTVIYNKDDVKKVEVSSIA